MPADASLTEYSRNVYVRTLRLRPLSASQIQTLPGAALRGATVLVRAQCLPRGDVYCRLRALVSLEKRASCVVQPVRGRPWTPGNQGELSVGTLECYVADALRCGVDMRT